MSGQCIRCGAETIYTSTEGITQGRGGAKIENIGERMVVPIPYQTEICTTCGCFFNLITDPEKLGKIKQMWTPAE